MPEVSLFMTQQNSKTALAAIILSDRFRPGVSVLKTFDDFSAVCVCVFLYITFIEREQTPVEHHDAPVDDHSADIRCLGRVNEGGVNVEERRLVEIVKIDDGDVDALLGEPRHGRGLRLGIADDLDLAGLDALELAVDPGPSRPARIWSPRPP